MGITLFFEDGLNPYVSEELAFEFPSLLPHTYSPSLPPFLPPSHSMGITLPFEDGLNPYVSEELAFEFHYFFTRKFWMVYHCQVRPPSLPPTLPPPV